VFYLSRYGLDTLLANYRMPVTGSVWNALFFGFAAAMLGISGFESSANFVEEQKRGVFPKTLRNMWIVVSVFNPLITFLALALVPIPVVSEHQEALLAYMGRTAGGGWLAWLVSIDAVLVLSGAVLTSYVGVGGLVHRMTLDRCLPQFLLKPNKRGTTYRIMIGFFILCVSVLLITRGELGALAGVYALSFLSVMALFGLGNLLLKTRRARLPRPERASGWALLVAIGAVLAALVGNAVMNPAYVVVFLQYFIPTVALVAVMLYRIKLLKLLLFLIRSLPRPFRKLFRSAPIRKAIIGINSQQFVYFTKGHNVIDLNKVMLYILKNEDTHRIKVVTVVQDEVEVPKTLASDIEVLDRAYPGFEVDFVVIKGKFGPELIDRLSVEWNIPKNFMFIASPGDHFPYRVSELGGVRLII
jgi:amino acid transporter